MVIQTRHLLACGGLLLSLLLSACGGGGGGSTPTTNTSNTTSSSSTGTATTGSGSSTSTSTVTLTPPPQSTVANQVAVSVYSGSDAGFTTFNRPFISVTICAPGTTTCQTIPNVLIDTGSSGLRIYNSALNSTMQSALQPIASSKGAVEECAQFAGGYLWGSVRNVDVKLAGEVAQSVPMQVSGDGLYSVPSSCSGSGPDLSNDPQSMGANGLIGLSQFRQDGGLYFLCSGTGSSACAHTLVSTQVTDPVTLFAQDNNGTVLTLNAAPVTGAPQVSGTLSFGVDTQADNTFTGQFYALNSEGNLTTTYNGKALSNSFFDSGSALYYVDDSSITSCTTSGLTYYCPSAALSLTASIQGAAGQSGTVPFSVSNLYNDYTAGNAALPAAAAPASGSSTYFNSTVFDWGLPFFFGKSVATVFEGANTASNVGPGIKF